MFITSIIENSEGMLRFGSNWTYTWGSLRKLVIHIIPLHCLFIHIKTQMNYSTPCQMHQLNHVLLCINNFLSCQLHIFFNMHFFTSKVQRGNETCQSFVASFILSFSWQNPCVQVKYWTSSNCVIWGGDHLSPHLRAPHNSMPYIRHYIPQTWWVVEQPNWEKAYSKSFFLNWTLNEAIIPWSKGCTTIVALVVRKK